MNRQSFINNWGMSENLQHLIVGEYDINNDSEDFEWWSFDSSQTTDPVNPHSAISIASNSKSMTAIGVLSLHFEGKLDINEPIHKYIDLDQTTENPITIKHLLTHTSGRPNDHAARYMIEDHLGVEEHTVDLNTYDQLLHFTNSVPSQFHSEPDTTFFYYNTGYMLLGHLIETVTDQTFEEYISDILFEPLEMNHTCFSGDTDSQPYVHTHYFPQEERFREIEPHHLPRILNPAGGVFSSLSDMMKYGKLLANKGKYNGEQILPEQLVTTLQESYIPNSGITTDSSHIHIETPVGVNTGKTKYTMGLETNEISGVGSVVGHHGDLGFGESQLTITSSKIVFSLSTPAKAGKNLSNFNMQFLTHTSNLGESSISADPHTALSSLLTDLEGTYAAHIPNYNLELSRSGSYLEYTTNADSTGILIPNFNPQEETSIYEFVEPTPEGQQKQQHIKSTRTGYVLYLDRNAFYCPKYDY